MIIISFFLPLISAQERLLNKKNNQTRLKIKHSKASVYCRELNPAAEEQKQPKDKQLLPRFYTAKPSPPGQNRPGNGTGRCLRVKGWRFGWGASYCGPGLCQSGAAVKKPLSGDGGKPKQQLIVAKTQAPSWGFRERFSYPCASSCLNAGPVS